MLWPSPPPPPLQNNVYVSLTLSDGDNVHYMQHHMKRNWSNVARGSTPIGWIDVARQAVRGPAGMADAERARDRLRLE